MNQETRKSEHSGYTDRIFTMASTTERDDWMTTFPHPMPDSHELRYVWLDDMHVMVGVNVKGDPKAKETHKTVTDLSAMSLAELQTKAAEEGIDVPKGATKHDIATAIEKHEKAGKRAAHETGTVAKGHPAK